MPRREIQPQGRPNRGQPRRLTIGLASLALPFETMGLALKSGDAFLVAAGFARNHA